MFRKIVIAFLILTLGLSPFASVWAGGSSSMSHEEMTMNADHDHSAMQQAEGDENQAKSHCKEKCSGDCDSSCCSSGACNSCGHCAAALNNYLNLPTGHEPHRSPISVSYSLESREFAPPFRPPLNA